MRLLELVTDLKASHNVTVKIIRCDNAGENKDADNHLRHAEKGVRFEYTSSGTPQHNGVMERRFATLYGRTRSMLHFCGCPETMKLKIWAECANVSAGAPMNYVLGLSHVCTDPTNFWSSWSSSQEWHTNFEG